MVSPVTTWTPAASAADFIEATTRRRSSAGRPSSMMRARLRYFGSAPHIARSFTVPQTLSLPMSPPGKNSGLTTKLSVEKASPPSSTAPSPRLFSAAFPRAGTIISSISAAVFLPPEP